MKVKELIKELQKQNPELEAVVEGYEDGYNSVCGLRKKKLIFGANKSRWYGEHDEVDDYSSKERKIKSVLSVEIFGHHRKGK